jgi:hypothetical protein
MVRRQADRAAFQARVTRKGTGGPPATRPETKNPRNPNDSLDANEATTIGQCRSTLLEGSSSAYIERLTKLRAAYADR